MKIRGKVHKLGDDINTDLILPGRYLKLPEQEAYVHVLEPIRPGFVHQVRPGDIIVAGRNFGGGSSRESAVTVLKLAGIGAIVAKSFARIFFRNALNLGLPVVEADLADSVEDGDTLEIDLELGTIHHQETNHTLSFSPLPPQLLELLQCGGLVPYLERRFSQSQGGQP
jgi:3-isopropylmalate/(R)-2-methylmalate dehydratase small subunit